ncbi:hypothetical protein ACVWXQ_008737 [Bradyrhizobium sp. S3.14.4]
MADAIDVAQIERIDHPADILGIIKEMIGIGLVARAVAAAVERIDGVARCKLARDLVPDVGDETGAVHEQRGRPPALAPLQHGDLCVGRAD